MVISSSSEKVRLDVLLVERGLAPSRERAQAIIMAGLVCSGDRLLTKPGQKVSRDLSLRLRQELNSEGLTYVSRGALKLKGALNHFDVSLKDTVCLDVGASTGGFTQVCLEYGARLVYAVDVGHSQLHSSLSSDPRVISMEKCNFRYAQSDLIPEKVDFVCIDCSFISLKLILPSVVQFCRPSGAKIIALIKPQHEVGKEEVGPGGIVTDSRLHEKVQRDLTQFAEELGFEVRGLMPSPLRGATGNQEFLLYLGYTG